MTIPTLDEVEGNATRLYDQIVPLDRDHAVEAITRALVKSFVEGAYMMGEEIAKPFSQWGKEKENVDGSSR